MNPRALATTVRFEYGTSTAYGTVDARAGDRRGHVERHRQRRDRDLKPGTRYNYRAVATSAAGITRGANRTLHDLEGADRRGDHALDDPPDLGQRA